MVQYFRTPAMQSGTGPFLCHNCGKKLAVKLKGQYEVHFACPRCHAYITCRVKEPLPWAKKESEPDSKPAQSTVEAKA